MYELESIPINQFYRTDFRPTFPAVRIAPRGRKPIDIFVHNNEFGKSIGSGCGDIMIEGGVHTSMLRSVSKKSILDSQYRKLLYVCLDRDRKEYDVDEDTIDHPCCNHSRPGEKLIGYSEGTWLYLVGEQINGADMFRFQRNNKHPFYCIVVYDLFLGWRVFDINWNPIVLYDQNKRMMTVFQSMKKIRDT